MTAPETTPLRLIAHRYQCEHRIGSGGMGEVFLAQDRVTGETVALKLIRPERAHRVRALRRFTREVRAMARLEHPAVATVYDYGVHVDEAGRRRPFFVMEYIAGLSLRQHLRANPPLEPTLELFDQMLAALAHAHARGIIHRDLKPENVLITRGPDGQRLVKLLDFGIARMIDDDVLSEDELEQLELSIEQHDPLSIRVLDEMRTIELAVHGPPSTARSRELDPRDASSDLETREDAVEGDDAAAGGGARLTQLNQCVGTPAYLAPEQARPRRYPVGPASDLYAIGVMLYEYVCGQRPFRAGSARELLKQHLKAPVPRVKPRPGLEVSEGLARLIRVLLRKHPLQRPAFAADVRRALRAAARGREATPALLPDGAELLEVEASRRSDRARHMGLGMLRFCEPPLVGRAAAQQALWAQLKRACRAAQVHAVIIDGEEGIGKSRLGRWLREWVLELGVARTFYAPYGAGQSGGLRHAIERHMGCHGVEGEALQQRLSEEATRRGLNDPWLVSSLSAFLRPREGKASERRTPRRVAADLALSEKILQRMTHERPVVFLLEDIEQASDAEGLELLAHLLDQLQGACPMLVVATVASEALMSELGLRARVEALARHPRALRLTLSPLDREHVQQMIAGLVPIEPRLATAIAERCGGHPLFATQLLHHWSEAGQLQPDASGQRLARVSAQPIPNRVNEIVERRVLGFLERLEREAGHDLPRARAAQRALEWMAICGVAMRAEVLSEVLLRDPHLDDPQAVLDEVLEAALLDGLCHEEGPLDGQGEGAQLRFDHPALCTVLLDRARALPDYTQRQALCAQVKLALAHNQDPALLYLEVSEHYREADAELASWRHLTRAALVARDTFRPRLALQHLEQAIARLPLAGPERPTAPELFDARQALIEALISASHIAEAQLQIEALGAQRPPDPGRGGWWLCLAARLDERRGVLHDARERYERALDLFAQAGDAVGRVHALRGLAVVQSRRGRVESALAMIDEAVAAARDQQDRGVLAETLRHQAAVLVDSGEMARAEVALFETLGIYNQQGNAEGRAEAFRELGRLYLRRADPAHARRYYESARDAYDAIGDRFGLAHSLNGLGEVLRADRQLPEAETAYFQALELIEGQAIPEDEAIFRGNLGLVQFHRGRLEEARQTLGEARDAFEALGARTFEAIVLAALICTEAERGDFSRCAAWVDRLDTLALDRPPSDRDHAQALGRAARVTWRAAQLPLARRLLALASEALDLIGEGPERRRLAALMAPDP